jgi:hypothetical protein
MIKKTWLDFGMPVEGTDVGVGTGAGVDGVGVVVVGDVVVGVVLVGALTAPVAALALELEAVCFTEPQPTAHSSAAATDKTVRDLAVLITRRG